MATDRQLATNRANAQKSTGPRTSEGKASSSTNALKSGIYSRSPLIPGEDPAEYDALHAELYESFNPANADERQLLDMMIENRWIHKRLQSAFHQEWTRDLEDDERNGYLRPHIPLVRTCIRNEEHFARLTRMIASLERSYHRHRSALIKTQKERRQSAPAPAPQPVEPKPTSPKLASFRQNPANPPVPLPFTPTPAENPEILPASAADPSVDNPAARSLS